MSISELFDSHYDDEGSELPNEASLDGALSVKQVISLADFSFDLTADNLSLTTNKVALTRALTSGASANTVPLKFVVTAKEHEQMLASGKLPNRYVVAISGEIEVHTTELVVCTVAEGSNGFNLTEWLEMSSDFFYVQEVNVPNHKDCGNVWIYAKHAAFLVTESGQFEIID